MQPTTQHILVTFRDSGKKSTARPVSELPDTGIIPSLIALMWSDAQLAAEFNTGKKKWQSLVAGDMGTTPRAIQSAINAFGEKAFHNIVNENPAGQSPAAAKVAKARIGENPTYTESCYCSHTCSCESHFCSNTCGCPSKHCRISPDFKSLP